MTDVNNLITEHIDIWTSAIKAKSASGRGSSKKIDLYGIKKLRELILELAVRGKLVQQDANDEPASGLIKKIQDERARLTETRIIKKQKALPPLSSELGPFVLPKGWRWIYLTDICILENGDRSKNYPNKSLLVNEGVPFINAGHLQNGRINTDEMTFITEDRFELLRAGKFTSGDILFCLRGSLGKSAVVEGMERGAIASSLVIVKSFYEGLTWYLHLFFDSPLCYRTIKEYDNGTAQPNLSAADLAKFLVPFPPLNEQSRVVTKVDELMALCDQLESQTENSIQAHKTLVETLLGTLTNAKDADDFQQSWQRISQHFDVLFTTEDSIDQLKQTILQLAVMGKLVKQDPNDEPASKLLERIVNEKEQLIKDGKIKKQKPLSPIAEEEKLFELPCGWQWCRVWNIAHIITSGSRDWAKYYAEDGAIFVTMGNLSRGHYQLRLDNVRYVNPPRNSEGNRTRLEENDLLISITGDVGNLGLIPKDFGEAYINQHTAMLRFMPECQNKFFPELMRSPIAKLQFDAPQRGIKNSFRLGDVGEMVIPIPPIREQQRIVSQVDKLMTICESLKEKLNEAQITQYRIADTLASNELCR